MINKLIAQILPVFPKDFIWLFSRKYIAGSNLDDAISIAKELNNNQIEITIDLLGEYINNIEEAERHRNEYLHIIDACEANNIKGNYSLKPSFFGMYIDENQCYENIRSIVKKATGYNSFVRIDMEDSNGTSIEIRMYKKLLEEFPDNVGLVFQSYLKRTFNDIRELINAFKGKKPLNFRLCKGIYIETEEIAYKKKKEINENFLKILELLFQNNVYAGIATHDKILIKGAYQLIEKYNKPKNEYEFQMLYGVTPELRNSIVKNGHKMRIYLPFGEEWLGYSLRRLKENPKMVSHIIKSLFHAG